MEQTSDCPLMPLNDDELKKVEEYAYDLLTWKDISYLLQRPLDKFKVVFDSQKSKLHLAYHAGRVKRKLELQKPILKLASMGSPQAEVLAIKFMKEQYLEESDE